MVSAGDLMVTQEVLDLFHIDRRTLRRWVQERRIPLPVRVGRRSLFSRAEMTAYLEGLRAQRAK
jgi:excisionase family DNA binding protein